MNEAAITKYIMETFEGVNRAEANGDSFFIWDPDRNFPPNKQIPFATLIARDDYDTVSDLSRPGVYRLNVGLSKATFKSIFGEAAGDEDEVGDGGAKAVEYDYTAFDTIMPHPTYGRQYWICVLNPSDATFERLKPMLAEAYAVVVKRNSKA